MGLGVLVFLVCQCSTSTSTTSTKFFASLIENRIFTRVHRNCVRRYFLLSCVSCLHRLSSIGVVVVVDGVVVWIDVGKARLFPYQVTPWFVCNTDILIDPPGCFVSFRLYFMDAYLMLVHKLMEHSIVYKHQSTFVSFSAYCAIIFFIHASFLYRSVCRSDLLGAST